MPPPHLVGGDRSPKVQQKSGKTIEEKRSRNTGGGSSARDIAVEEEIRELLSKAGDLGDGATGSYQGSSRDATKLYEKATGLAEKYYGNVREETLNIRGWWAASLRRTGDLKKAITCDLKNVEWALEGLKQCQRASGTNSAEILSAKERHLDFQRRLARSYLANQQPAWAIPIFRTVAAADVPISAEQTRKDRVDLASALFESGTDQHIMEAVNLNILTLKTTEKALGKDHIETVKVRYNLGRELYELKKYNDALKKFGELLKILKAKNCEAKAAPDYREILEDTEVSLMNCSERVARQEGKIKPQIELEAETKRRGEEYRREMAIRVEEAENHMARQKKMAEQQSLFMTEEKRRNAELRGQVVEQLQVKEKSAQREEKKTAQQKSKEGTRQQGIDKEVQRQLAERTQAEEAKGTQRRLETQTAKGNPEKDQGKVKGQQEKEVLYAKLQGVDSRASTPKDRKGKEVERPKRVDHDGAGQQKREREREDPGREQSYARTATTKPTKSSNPDERALNAWQDIKRKPSEQTSKTVKPRMTDATKPSVGTPNELPRNQSSTSARGDSSPLTEANLRQLPSPQRSASAQVASNSLTEANMRQLQRSKSTRSNANKTTRSGGPDNFGSVTRHVDPDRTTENEREQANPVPEFAVPTRVSKSEVPDKPRKERHVNKLSMVKSHLASVAEQANGKNDTSVKDRATDTRSPRADTNLKTPSEQRTKSERDDRPKSALERTRPSENDRASRRLSAPVITPSERDSTGQGEDIQGKKRSTPSVVSETHGKIERERPKSSQSHYRKGLSASTADQSTGPRSGSTESRQTKQSPGASSDLTPAAVQMAHFLESAGKATEPMKERKPDRLRQSSAKHDETGIADAPKAFLDRSEGSCEIAGPGVTAAMSRDDNQEPAFSLGDAENDVTIHAENGHTPPQINVVKERMTDNTTSEIHSSKPVIITRTILADTTGTLAQFVPGGWHQDFDEPDHHRKPRRARSNDQEGLGGLRVSNIDDLAHRRASSVNLRRAHLYTAKTPPLRTWDPQDEIRADEWFTRLRARSHVLLDKYKDDFWKATKSERRVKIAVLDSGVAKSSANGPVPPLMKGPRIKFGKQLDPSLPWNVDTKGHGTHAAGLVLTVCPYADVYVYRVCEDNDSIDRKHVAEAITDAVDRKKVDIISMSFGWEGNSDLALEKAIQHARAHHVLLFAASSNEGIRTHAGMAYPARAFEVIAVDAADVHGNPSKFNPPQTGEKARFTALGEAVRSTYPMHLPSEDPEPGWKRLDGTSCATPIAAGIAGLVLEFARQRPMCFDERIEERLKTVEGMQLILTQLVSRKSAENSRFHHLDPTFLFGDDEKHEDGGDWAEAFVPRSTAANNIVVRLREVFSQEIGSSMKAELYKEWARRGLR